MILFVSHTNRRYETDVGHAQIEQNTALQQIERLILLYNPLAIGWRLPRFCHYYTSETTCEAETAGHRLLDWSSREPVLRSHISLEVTVAIQQLRLTNMVLAKAKHKSQRMHLFGDEIEALQAIDRNSNFLAAVGRAEYIDNTYGAEIAEVLVAALGLA